MPLLTSPYHYSLHVNRTLAVHGPSTVRLVGPSDANITLHLCRTNEVDLAKQKSKKQKDEEEAYGCNYQAIVTHRQQQYFTTSWGPVGFKKSNHPLAIMVSLLYYYYLQYSATVGNDGS